MKTIWKPAILSLICGGMLLLGSCGTANSDPASSAPEDAKDYTITKVADADSIDWATIPEAAIDQVLWTDDAGIRAAGQLCYDEENLYIRLHATEKDIRAENTEPLSPVYEDSCLEFFFMKDGAGNYFNFEMNANGCACIQYGPAKTDRFDLYREDEKNYFDIHPARTSDGWEICYRIPLKCIQTFCADFEFRGDFRANLYKCGNKTKQKHYLAWSPVHSDTPDFHRPEDFGIMHFEE